MKASGFIAFAAGAVTATPAAARSSDAADMMLGLVAVGVIVLLLALYFLPSIVAFRREHPNRWVIFALNLVFGTTVIGWIGTLIWAFNGIHISKTGNNGGESGLNAFVNDERQVRISGYGPPATHPRPPQAAAHPGPWPTLPRPAAAMSDDEIAERLNKLRALKDSGALDEGEYARLRQPLLDRLASG